MKWASHFLLIYVFVPPSEKYLRDLAFRPWWDRLSSFQTVLVLMCSWYLRHQGSKSHSEWHMSYPHILILLLCANDRSMSLLSSDIGYFRCWLSSSSAKILPANLAAIFFANKAANYARWHEASDDALLDIIASVEALAVRLRGHSAVAHNC